MAEFKVNIDVQQIADSLNKTREVIEEKVTKAVEALSVSAHAFIVNKANTELGDFKRKFFLGQGEYGKKTTEKSTSDPRIDQTAKNVRWVKVANGLWVVEIDEKAAWIEEGRPATSMATEEWLLKPGAKGVKRAKDGSLYRSIPFKQTEGNKPAPGVKPAYESIIKSAMKKQGIHKTKIEKDESGQAKLGILHKLKIEGPEGGWMQYPSMHSKPRTAEEAAQTGLKPHEGIFHLKGAVVVQREKTGKKGGKKIVKETVVFRTVSTKHQLENRWMYPEVKPFGAIPAAHQWALQQWTNVLKSLEEELNQASGR